MYERSLETKERVGDVHGMAQTFNNLGLVYADKGEWDRAIEMYERSLETLERVGDVHGMAATWTNIGSVLLGTNRIDEAKPLFAQAFLVFSQMGSPNAQQAGNGLVQTFDGDVEATNAYLAQFAEQQAS